MMFLAELSSDPEDFRKKLDKKGAEAMEKIIQYRVQEVSKITPEQAEKLYEENIKKIPDLSNEAEAMVKSNFKSLIDFAKSFKSTFPGGIKILPEDTTEIIGHFVPVPAPQQKQGKDRNEIKI
jgi:hypothetical protein